VRKYLNKNEIDRVIGELDTPFDLISTIQVYTGRRPTEVLLVKPQDIDHENKIIEFIQLKKRGALLYEKDGHKRYARKKVTKPIDCSAFYDELYRYMSKMPMSTYLFPSSYDSDQHVNIRTLQRKVKKAGEQSGISVHPHMFRHSFAVQYLEKRINKDEIDPIQALFELKNILGHASIDTTMGYLAYVTGKESLKGLWGL